MWLWHYIVVAYRCLDQVIVNFTVGDKGESTYEAAAPTVLQSLTLMYAYIYGPV